MRAVWSTYYHGYKRPLLLSVSPIQRALSDEFGQMQGQTIVYSTNDTSRYVRGLLGDPATRLLQNSRVVVRVISDPDRRLLRTPRTVAIGIVRSYPLG